MNEGWRNQWAVVKLASSLEEAQTFVEEIIGNISENITDYINNDGIMYRVNYNN